MHLDLSAFIPICLVSCIPATICIIDFTIQLYIHVHKIIIIIQKYIYIMDAIKKVLVMLLQYF